MRLGHRSDQGGRACNPAHLQGKSRAGGGMIEQSLLATTRDQATLPHISMLRPAKRKKGDLRLLATRDKATSYPAPACQKIEARPHLPGSEAERLACRPYSQAAGGHAWELRQRHMLRPCTQADNRCSGRDGTPQVLHRLTQLGWGVPSPLIQPHREMHASIADATMQELIRRGW